MCFKELYLKSLTSVCCQGEIGTTVNTSDLYLQVGVGLLLCAVCRLIGRRLLGLHSIPERDGEKGSYLQFIVMFIQEALLTLSNTSA